MKMPLTVAATVNNGTAAKGAARKKNQARKYSSSRSSSTSTTVTTAVTPATVTPTKTFLAISGCRDTNVTPFSMLVNAATISTTVTKLTSTTISAPKPKPAKKKPSTADRKDHARKAAFCYVWKLLPTDAASSSSSDGKSNKSNHNDWMTFNRVGPSDTPPGLAKQVSESILVFSFNSKSVLNGKNIVDLGATMYRRNQTKQAKPLERVAKAVMRFDADGNISHRWTDWNPDTKNNNTNDCDDDDAASRMRPGIFIWLVRSYLNTNPSLLSKDKVCVVCNDRHLEDLDKELCGLDSWNANQRYSHYIFAENDDFPPESGWY